MKKNIFIIILLYCNILITSQLVANAGLDKHKCKTTINNQDTIFIGGNPSASGGTGQYTFTWKINPIKTIISTQGYLYASDILNDTAIANPKIVYENIGDSVEFFLTIIDSNGNIAYDSVLVSFSLFNHTMSQYEYWIDEGDSIFLTQSPNISGGYGDITYEWQPSEGLNVNNLQKDFWAKPDTSTWYYLTITDSKSCSEKGGNYYRINVNKVGIGINDYRTEIDIYPNPIANTIEIETNIEMDLIYKVYNIDGKEIMTNIFNKSVSIDFSQYNYTNIIVNIYKDDLLLNSRKLIKMK